MVMMEMYLYHGEMSGCELRQSPGGGNAVNMSLSVTIKHGAETFARYERECPICLDFIEPEDPITGVYINGEGHTWDCRTKCGLAPQYVETRDGEMAETFARFETKCAVCKEPIKKKDPICGVFIDGQGHEWDCKTMCGAIPKYAVNKQGFRMRLPCRHFNEIFWVHRSCSY